MGKLIELTAADGHRLAAYRADPAGKPRGAIVVIQEIFGVNSHIKEVADGFAADGYVAIAPAMFDRVQKNVDLGYTPPDIEKGRELRAKITLDFAMKDAEAAVKAAAPAGKIGIVGYCWGGFVAWMASARVPGLAAAVPYYGGGILDNTDIQPPLRREGRDDPGRRREEARREAPEAADLPLPGGSRLQLRSPRVVSRAFGQAGAGAHASVSAKAPRLSRRAARGESGLSAPRHRAAAARGAACRRRL